MAGPGGRRGWLRSPRFRRRLLWVGVPVALVVAAVTIFVAYPNTVTEVETFSEEPADLYERPTRVTLTPESRQAISDVTRLFVETAVAREHPERAYHLVGPYLKNGMSRAEWAKGDIPVIYYPVDGARWKLQYATSEEVGINILLVPRKDANVRPVVFNMALVPHPGEQRWLITAFSPAGGTPATAPGGIDRGPGGFDDLTERYAIKTSPLWLGLPLLLLALALAFPLGLAARGRLAARRRRDAESTG